ncbi:MAG: NAD(P)-binding domain-containing protein [Candidatus Pacebacteria bacterium]|nr:NAD(P)-binding domain-containing protein [Candidatus Paceibacterota bacterium]
MDHKKIGILGSGKVGQVLAKAFIVDGYDVMVGSRDGHRAAEVDMALGMDVATGTFREVAEWGELIILAVKGGAVEGVAGELAGELAGKTVIDVTNPISDDPPENGVLHFFTTLEMSLGERIQVAVPEAHVVKAWNSVGYAHMIDPEFNTIPTMPICGNDESARKEVADIVRGFGWEVEDMGMMTSARAIEPLCMLWCIPGFLRGEWNHVFKMVRK